MTGVLLLNLGGPDSLDAVKPFLYNLFSDRDIIKLGPEFLQKPIAAFIAATRSGKTRAMYSLIGGKSPILDITKAQAAARPFRHNVLVRPTSFRSRGEANPDARIQLQDLYRDLIIDHYKNPQYRGHLDPNDIHFEDDNPLCGDHIEMTLRVDADGKVAEGRFDGKGCAISQASADLLVESIIGKPVEDVKKLSKQDVLDLLGIELGPVRLKCALLSLKVLKAGVYGLGESSDDLVE